MFWGIMQIKKLFLFVVGIPGLAFGGVHVQQNDPTITIGSMTLTTAGGSAGIKFADGTTQTTAGGGGGGGGASLSSTNTWTAAQIFTSSVSVSTNTILPGATFYQSVGAFISIASMTSTLPMSGRKITGLANGTASTDAINLGQMKVVQVVSSFTIVAFTTTSQFFQKTKTSMTITPLSASDQIMILAVGVGNTPPNKVQFFQLFRNSIGLGGTSGVVDAGGDASGIDVPATVFAVDAPVTTSPITYYVAMSNSDNTSTVQWGSGVEIQTIILIEFQP